jgi:hypothetical protein
VTGNPGFDCPGGSFAYPSASISNPLRLGVAFDPGGTGPATARASMLPSVGDVIADHCGANDFGSVTDPILATVSRDDLLSGRAVTFSFSGTGSTPSGGDHMGTPITWTLTTTLTVQRVQADGSPL